IAERCSFFCARNTVWNMLVEGFGNHDPGKGRRQGMRPLWDMLHPGRPWAEKLQPHTISAAQIAADALQYLTDRYAVLDDFTSE
ncbi:MAG: Eco29kI family restriction endonuclease, partial [Olegusella sp.]|nr:Eco29kI family restriction endonuclease [Olegusella sp.]